MAESCDYMATKLEAAMGGDPSKLNSAVQSLLQEVMQKHKAVVFNGDGYSEAWHQEAEKRGLPNMRTTLEALPVLLKPEVSALFEKYKVLSAREVHSRYEIFVERYCKDINTESLTAAYMARTLILPAAYRYQGELAATAANLKTIGKTPCTKTLDVVIDLVGKLEETTSKLEGTIEHTNTGDVMAHAKHFRDAVLPAMNAVRTVADKLETIVPDDLWPLPTYREMLFIK
jgi:glutamine synthetase